jgi:hypothetical protein
LEIAKKIGELTDYRVQDGPFRGMILYPELFGQHMSPKLLGTYEDELHSFFYRAKQINVDCVVNVGSAEGYYSVGASLLWKNAVVHSFDLVKKSRLVTAKHGRINGVSKRLKIGGRAEPATLESIIKGADAPLVISDCEGFEVQLLDPALAPSLSNAIIVCEMHPEEVPEVAEVFRSRFDMTHDLSVIDPRKKIASDYKSTLSTLGLGEDEEEISINEFRGFTPWMIMTPVKQGLDCTT